MALRHSAFYSPYLMTMAGGFLKDEGLEYSYEVQTPRKTVADSIENGSCHVAQSAVAASFGLLESGREPPFVHFAQINERDGFFLVSRWPDREFNWRDLEGKRVLVDHFFQPYAMFKYALYKKQVDPGKLHILDAGDVEGIEAEYREGRGGYVHMQGPSAQQLEKDGLGRVVASIGEAIGPVAFSSLCASPEWLKTDMARAFMAAYRKARAFVLESAAEEIAQILKSEGFFTLINDVVLTNTIDTYKGLGCWAPSVDISPESYETLLDVFTYNGMIQKLYRYDKLIAAVSE